MLATLRIACAGAHPQHDQPQHGPLKLSFLNRSPALQAEMDLMSGA
jgi:hypothetical protein